MRAFIKTLHPLAIEPTRGSDDSAGYDLHACEDTLVPARGQARVNTGIALCIDDDHVYMRLAPRSGLASKHGLHVGAGVIDPDYHGPISVILFNHTDQDYLITCHDRIAQMIFERFETPDFISTQEFPSSSTRGEQGFGSTGK